MKRSWLFLIGLSGLSMVAGAVGLLFILQRLFSGEVYRGNPSMPGQFPHVVKVTIGTNPCTGVLLGPHTLLSAGKLSDGEAHCMPDVDLQVKVESPDWAGGESYFATVLDRHPTLDLGVACLPKEADLNLSTYGELPDGEVVPTTQHVRAVGFGQTLLQKLKLDWTGPRLPTYGDDIIASNTITDATFIVSAGMTACSGDSGGPAFVEQSNVIAGIAEAYAGYNQCGYPVLYTRVDSESVRKWILAKKNSCES